jgi:pyridoxamine 5'-phosphate oxidase
MTSMRTRLRDQKSLVGTPPAFDPNSAPDDPRTLFEAWFGEAVAAGIPEPHAMTLSTVGADGVPDARVLILKDVTDDGGWTFASARRSAKGLQLRANPVAALTFYWPTQLRSVRLRGPVVEATADEAAEDFRERGLTAKAIALAGTQSEPAEPNADAIGRARARLIEDPSLVAPDWTLWRLHPASVEFWQGSESREHLRLQYTRVGEGWSRRRLWP